MVASIPVQAVVLVGGSGSRLHPLNSAGTPKALVTVGNQALLHYPLRSLEEAGIRDVFLVCSGEATCSKVSQWITKSYAGKLRIQVNKSSDLYSPICRQHGVQQAFMQTSWVPDGKDTADALRSVLDSVLSSIVVVVSGDLVTNLSLQVSC